MLTAIVGILLGNLLIATLFAPSLQKLREILGKFADIRLPHQSARPGTERMRAEQRHDAQESAASDFNATVLSSSLPHSSLSDSPSMGDMVFSGYPGYSDCSQ